MLKPIKDTLLVHAPQTHKDNIDGWYLDPLYDPTAHAETTLEVVQVPAGASSRYQSDLERIEIGDKVVVNYKWTDDGDNKFGEEFKYEDGIYALPIRWIFAIIKKDGTIIPFSEWLIGEYTYPENAIEVDVDGKKVMVIESSVIPGFIVESDVKPLKNKARILHDPTGLLEGLVVEHAEAADWEYEIEGKDLLVIYREHVYGNYIS